MTTEQLILAILGTGGLGAVLAAIITGYFSRRRLSADATHLITQAASGVVERIEAELGRTIRVRDDALTQVLEQQSQINELREAQARQRKDFESEMRAKEQSIANMQEEWRQALQLHAAWDAMALAKLEENDIEHGLPSPPPLYPPAHRRDQHRG